MNEHDNALRKILAKLNEKLYIEHQGDGPAPKLHGVAEAAQEIADLIGGPATSEPAEVLTAQPRVIKSFKDFVTKNEDTVPVVFVEPQEMSPEEVHGILTADLITDQPQLAPTAEPVTGIQPDEVISDIVSDTPISDPVADIISVPQDGAISFDDAADPDGIPMSHTSGTPFDPALLPALSYAAPSPVGTPDGLVYPSIDPEPPVAPVATAPAPITTQAEPHWWEESEALAGRTVSPMSESANDTNYMALETLVSEHLFLQYIVTKRENTTLDRSAALRYAYKNYVIGDAELEKRFAELTK